MILRWAHLCDFGTVDGQGKPIIVGSFNLFHTSADDVCRTPPFWIFAAIEASVIEGLEHAIAARLLDPDGAELGAVTFHSVRTGTRVAGRPGTGFVLYQQQPMELPLGDYVWEIGKVVADGMGGTRFERFGELPFAVVRFEPPKPQVIVQPAAAPVS